MIVAALAVGALPIAAPSRVLESPAPKSTALHPGEVRTTPGVAAFVSDHRLVRYAVALADLNEDGRPEALVYAMADEEAAAPGDAANLCGSGGCDLYVLSLTQTGYRQIAKISVTRPPIRMLPHRSHGWRDLGVLVAGGGILPGYEARLSFDGRSYPSNPTVPPATRLWGNPGGVVIATMPPLAAAP